MTLSKKIFIGSSSLLLIVLVFWGIYNLSFKKSAPPISNSSAPAPVKEIPKNQISAISDEAVMSPALSQKEDSIIYYSKNSGKIYEVAFDGSNKNAFSTQEVPGISNVSWSPDKTRVITSFVNGNNITFFYYNHTENKGTPIKPNVDNIAWQNNNKILYKYYDPKTKERTLNFSDPNGSNWQKISDIEFRNINILSIPKTSLVSYWNAPDAFSETKLESIPLLGGEKKTLFSGKFGADYLWNNGGTSLLVSHSDSNGGKKMQLAIINDRGGEYKNLDLPTLVSKCTWSKDDITAFCALPSNIPDNSILPNDYNSHRFFTADTFWKINTQTGEKERIVNLDKIPQEYDSQNLFLNPDESSLFFVNRVDGKLYRIQL